jgi:hypothetical protein
MSKPASTASRRLARACVQFSRWMSQQRPASTRRHVVLQTATETRHDQTTTPWLETPEGREAATAAMQALARQTLGLPTSDARREMRDELHSRGFVQPRTWHSVRQALLREWQRLLAERAVPRMARLARRMRQDGAQDWPLQLTGGALAALWTQRGDADPPGASNL